MDETTTPTDTTTQPIEPALEPAVVLDPTPDALPDVSPVTAADEMLPVVEPAAQHVEVVSADLPTVEAGEPTPPQVIEHIVERIVEKEVIKEVIKEVPVEKIVERIVEKEVPVEKIVEKIVYKDAEPRELSDAELETMKHNWLLEMAHQGAEKKRENMRNDLDHILELFNTKPEIHNKDVMEALGVVSSTATKYLHILTESGKITMSGAPHGGPTTRYSKL